MFSPNKKAFNTAFAGLTLSLYSLKNDFRLYYQSIERRSRGVQVNKRPVASRAFVFLNRILSTLNGMRKIAPSVNSEVFDQQHFYSQQIEHVLF